MNTNFRNTKRMCCVNNDSLMTFYIQYYLKCLVSIHFAPYKFLCSNKRDLMHCVSPLFGVLCYHWIGAELL
jgi:hypothetical protein